jgi:oligopeptide/dipeptide ABC transporter ATP-binding protein
MTVSEPIDQAARIDLLREPAMQSDASDTLLSVRNLRTEFVTYDGVVTAVRDVSFDLGRLERLGIVGESGCGKSALALSIFGLIEAPGRIVSGEILLNGRDLRALSDRQMQRVRGKEMSLVFQDPMTALNPIKPIGAQLTDGIRKHQSVTKRQARQMAIELLRDTEVPYAERRLADYPHQYSGGMRQRVMIAIALANQPDLLVADEPTTALDVTTQAQVLDLLARVALERDAAIILITHNFGIVAEFCTSVQVMYAGRIVERAAAADVFRAPVHPYTEALLKSVPRPDRLVKGRLPTIPGVPPSLLGTPHGCSFEPRCPVGHGNPRCQTEPPLPFELARDSGTAIAECHFANERLHAPERLKP